MPTFCRHGRFEASCAICRQEKAKAEPKPVASPKKGTGARRPASSVRAPSSRPARSRSVVTGKLQRHADDGFSSELLPGVRSSAAALDLARELVTAEARLEALPSSQGWEVVAAHAGEPAKAFIVALTLAVASPDGPGGSAPTVAAALAALQAGVPELDDVAGVAAASELAVVLDAGPRGPRAHDASALALAAPAALSQRHGGSLETALAGDANWTPERRFARLLDRLALKGLPRAVRYDTLVGLARCGALPVKADALHLGSDQVTDAAKRLFAVADVALLERRAAALADATGVTFDALELALWNVAGADAAGTGAASRWATAKPATDRGVDVAIDEELVEATYSVLS